MQINVEYYKLKMKPLLKYFRQKGFTNFAVYLLRMRIELAYIEHDFHEAKSILKEHELTEYYTGQNL